MTPSLDELRCQCRIDGDAEDALLQIYRAAALEKAQEYLNRPLFENEVPDGVSDGLLINNRITLAIMLAVGHWYEQREATTKTVLHEVPLGFYALLCGMRKSPGT